MDNSITQFTITSTLTSADMQRIRRALAKWRTHFDLRTGFSGRDRRVLVEIRDGSSVHREAKNLMLAIGRTFNYDC